MDILDLLFVAAPIVLIIAEYYIYRFRENEATKKQMRDLRDYSPDLSNRY